ncbi:orotate phosphoribosyltransferase [Clostridia bacterium]|nr:orotate phosphoribosyltransferase [Clostridia bacterium]
MDRTRAEEILTKAGALLTGHFRLTSGKHSGKYMQCAQILQYPEFTAELAEDLSKNFENADIVVGPAMGGIVIAYELARHLRAKSFFTERVDGKMVLRRNFTIPEGARVVVAEDVITTGGSVREVIEIVREQGGNVIGVAVLVDRSGGSVDFGVPLACAYKADIAAYEAEDCPLCKEGKMPVVKPGSRAI